MMFFLIFSETVLRKEMGIFALHSVQQDASFELSKTTFGNFFIFSLNGLERKERQFWKWHGHSNKMGGCRSCYCANPESNIALSGHGHVATH